MGISQIVAIMSTTLFAFSLFLKGRINPALLFPLLHASTVGFIAAISSHPTVNLPLLFGKTRKGSFPCWSLLLFYPYLFFLRLYVKMRRMISREAVYNEVCPQLYVGGWPCSASDIPPGQPAVIDCTCELPKSLCVENMNLPYLCIPTWDTRAPSHQDIDLAVRWAAGQRLQNRPIFVHCAFGHGRSVAVMCALLVALGFAEDWKDAEKIIKKCRPGLNMNILHRKSLEKWGKFRVRPNEHLENSNESLSFLSNNSHGDKPEYIKPRISSSN